MADGTNRGRLWIAAAVVAACAAQACGPVAASGPATAPSGPVVSTPASTRTACCTALERDVIDALNRARTDPAGFANELEARLPHYRGYIYRAPGAAVGMRTVEGAAAVREAVRVLRATRPLPPLRFSRGMSAAAADHVRDQGPRGGLGHTGRDRSTAPERVSRYGRWFGVVSENIQYGAAPTGRDVIADLVIDDGVPDRGHRRNILDPVIRVAGVACGPHANYTQMCVIVHAADFAEGAPVRPTPGR
jgi:uncharacterized protein YkwD